MADRRMPFWRRRGVRGAAVVGGGGHRLGGPAGQPVRPSSRCRHDRRSGLHHRQPERPVTRRRTAPTTDIHLLAYNDFHGNLEAGRPEHLRPVRRRRGLPGQGHQGSTGAVPQPHHRDGGRQHRRQPAGQRPLLRGAGHHRVEPDVHRLRLGREPRVRQGQRRAAAHPERWLPAAVEGCTAKPYALPYNKKTNVYPGANFKYLSANVIVDQHRQDAVPGLRREADRRPRRRHQRRVHRRGAPGARLTIVTPTGVAGLTFLDEADAANKAVKDLKRKGVNTIVLLIHQGGFQSGPGRPERLRRQPGRQRHR